MPVVVPAGTSASSSAQSLSGQYVYDYILDENGVGVSGATVTATLNGGFFTSISPAVVLQPTQRSTTTDSNGFWQLSLIPNTNLSPANSTYTIKTPFRTYDITVGASGPYQSTSTGTLVSVITALSPATTGIIGSLSVLGALTVSGGAAISGGLTVASGTFSIPGGSLSILGPLTLTAATSQIIPGATNLSLRNNANSADNLLISNAGAVTVRAGLTVTTGGAVVTAGGLTVTGAPDLTLGTAASRIKPGVTSLSLRNNANNADNLLLTDVGNATVRGSLTVTGGGFTLSAGSQTIATGNLTLTAGNLTFAAAASKIVPGATSFAIRNNADSQNNLLLSNAGAMTILAANAVTPPTTSWGTVPVKIDDQLLGAGAASITFAPNPLPTGFRHLLIEWYARGDTAATSTGLLLRLNNDSGANYDTERLSVSGAAATAIEALAATSAQIGVIPANTATANYFGAGEAKLLHYNGTTGNKVVTSRGFSAQTNTAGNQLEELWGGKWRTTATAVTRLDLLPGAGNFVVGSVFTLWGIP